MTGSLRVMSTSCSRSSLWRSRKSRSSPSAPETTSAPSTHHGDPPVPRRDRGGESASSVRSIGARRPPAAPCTPPATPESLQAPEQPPPHAVARSPRSPRRCAARGRRLRTQSATSAVLPQPGGRADQHEPTVAPVLQPVEQRADGRNPEVRSGSRTTPGTIGACMSIDWPSSSLNAARGRPSHAPDSADLRRRRPASLQVWLAPRLFRPSGAPRAARCRSTFAIPNYAARTGLRHDPK